MAIRVPKLPLRGNRHRQPWPLEEQEHNGEVQLRERAAELQAGIVGWVDERTGASGFLGGSLCTELAQRGHEPVAMVRRQGSGPADVAEVRGDLPPTSVS